MKPFDDDPVLTLMAVIVVGILLCLAVVVIGILLHHPVA